MYKKQRAVRSRSAASAVRDELDLKEVFNLSGVIKSVLFTVQGNQVSTAGGAISGFAREAPWSIISILSIEGQYRPTGKLRKLLDSPPQEMYWPFSFQQNSPGLILTTSAGASSTDPIRGVMPWVFCDRNHPLHHLTYIDSRDYETLELFVSWGADSSMAATNLSSLSSIELEISIEEQIDRLASVGHAHFDPVFVSKDNTIGATTNTRVVDNASVTFDGLATAVLFRQHDDSASGNSQRVDGLVRFLTVNQGGIGLLDNESWQSMLRKVDEQYPLGLTTSKPAGVAGLRLIPTWDSRRGSLSVIRDTSSTNPVGITAIVAAASDKLVTNLLCSVPNAEASAHV